jgi:hypothetical protein
MLGLRGRRSHETHAPADAMAEVGCEEAGTATRACCLLSHGVQSAAAAGSQSQSARKTSNAAKAKMGSM